MPVQKQVIQKTALAPTVLIAGGAGFIGSHLAETLLLKDARVVVLDNFKTGKRNYVEHLLNNSKFALFDVDISRGLPEEIGTVDYIFHLAGLESYLFNQSDVNLDALLTNALGTKNLLDLATKSQAKFVLASTIDVYQGMMSPVDLNKYFGGTNEEEKKFSLTEAKRYAEALVWEYFKKNTVNARIVRIPEVYGPKMDFSAAGNLGSMLNDMVNKKNLTVFGDGSKKQYYLFVLDVVSGLVKSLFSPNTEGKIFNLVGNEPFSSLEIAYLLKSLADGGVDIKFKPEPSSFNFFDVKSPDRENLEILKWEAKIPFRTGLIKTLTAFGYNVNENTFKPSKLIEEKLKAKVAVSSLAPVQEMTPQTVEVKQGITSLAEVKESAFSQQEYKEKNGLGLKINFPRMSFGFNNRILIPISILLSFILIFIILPVGQTYFTVKAAVKSLEQIPTLVTQLDSETSKNKANEAYISFSKAQNSFSKVKWIFKILGRSEQHDSINGLLSSASYFSKSAYNLSKAANPFNQIWETIKPNSNKYLVDEDFDLAKVNIEIAKNNLQLALANIKNTDINALPQSLISNVLEYEKMINSVSDGLYVLLSATESVPELLGSDEIKKYLILFQNSNEIRPTGGFIGSYAILELEKGKIKSLTIDDVYNPDGQLDVRNVKVAPPKPIENFLKETRFYIRNANWNPNFPNSAQDIDNLFYRLNGEHFDGVLAVDLAFVQSLLRVTGPTFLAAYNEEITADNLFERTQFHSEFNYSSGSDQKRSFLTILGSKLLESVFALSKEKMSDLFNNMNKSLNEKHILVHILNSPFAAVLNEGHWDGSLVSTEGDYLYVVNANLGGTKSNYYIENKMKYEVSSLTRDGLLRGELTLDYTHNGSDDAWPGGPYTNYVRVLTQTGTKLTGAKLFYAEEPEKDIFKEVIISKEGAYNSFETNFKLETGKELKLVINFDLSNRSVINQENMEYRLYWQKQPGTLSDSVEFVFNPPFGLTLDPSVSTVSIEGEKGVVRDNLLTDKSYYLKLK